MLFLSIGHSLTNNTEETRMTGPLHLAPWETGQWPVVELGFKEKHFYNTCLYTATAESRKYQKKDIHTALWEFRGGRDKFQLRDLWKDSDSG